MSRCVPREKNCLRQVSNLHGPRGTDFDSVDHLARTIYVERPRTSPMSQCLNSARETDFDSGNHLAKTSEDEHPRNCPLVNPQGVLIPIGKNNHCCQQVQQILLLLW